MTRTFITKDKKFEFTVKSEFYDQVPNPEEFPAYDIMVEKQVHNFLHNPNGPAIVQLETKEEAYFLDGKEVSEEEAKKIKHAGQFNDRLDDLISQKD
jgi:hypothetical protein